ncbi:DMT family transporter, partial [bacterium]|nr:DMT family transporter [bacterium]
MAATALAGLLWGSSFVVVKHGLRSIDPYWFVLLRFSAAAVLAVAYAAVSGRLREVGRLLRHPLVIWLGISNGIGFALQFNGQTLTTAGKAALFVNSNMVFVAIASCFVLRERFTRAKAAAVVVGMLGVFMVTTGGSLRFTPGPELAGDMLILTAAVVWTVFVLLNKELASSDHVDLRALTAAMVTLTALTALPLALVFGRGGPPALDGRLWVVGYTAVFCTVLPFFLWTWGLRSISATSSCVILLVEIVFALVLAGLVFGERLVPGAMVGAAMIVG